MPNRTKSPPPGGTPTPAPTPVPIDAPERRRLPPLLRRSWFSLNQAFRRRITHLKITPDQFTVMRTLLEAGAGGLNQRELTQQMSSDPNTVASLLSRMEAAELIRRTPHELDRRAHRIVLLATGRRKYEAARAEAIVLQAEVLAVLDEEHRESFLGQLHRIANACRDAADRSPRGK